MLGASFLVSSSFVRFFFSLESDVYYLSVLHTIIGPPIDVNRPSLITARTYSIFCASSCIPSFHSIKMYILTGDSYIRHRFGRRPQPRAQELARRTFTFFYQFTGHLSVFFRTLKGSLRFLQICFIHCDVDYKKYHNLLPKIPRDCGPS